MFNFLKTREQAEKQRAKERQQAAYRQGQQAGEAITAAIDAFLDPRLAQLKTNLLGVFAQRLLTIQDSPPHPPQLTTQRPNK